LNRLSAIGAGDVFHGALLAARVDGADWETAIRFANAAAALKCTGLTGCAALPPRAEIERLAGIG
jgi:sugar/nucleoside kinase (ribokinase family)